MFGILMTNLNRWTRTARSTRARWLFAYVLLIPAATLLTGCPLFFASLGADPIEPQSGAQGGPGLHRPFNTFGPYLGPPESQQAGQTYEPIFFRQPDCSLTLQIGSLSTSSAFQPSEAISGFQNYLRANAGLTPAVLPHPYAGGCKDPRIGIASSSSFLPLEQLANGGYEVATIGSTGIGVELDSPNGSTSGEFIDTSNGSSTAFPTGIATADLNGDGIPDLVVANGDYGSAEGANLTILLGKKGGSFGPPFQIRLPDAAARLYVSGFTLADVNGDGKLDIVLEQSVSGSGLASLVWFAGKGNGRFDAPVVVAIPPPQGGANALYGAVAAADLNHDGHVDIADSAGQVFLGNGKGEFDQVASSGLNEAAGLTFQSLAIADLNHDGKLDIAFTDSQLNAVSVFLGKGDGSFSAGQSYATVQQPDEIAVSDLDGDGHPDLIVGVAGGGIYSPDYTLAGVAHILLGRGDGTFASPRLFPAPGSASQFSAAVVADFNGDGKPDVVQFAVGVLFFENEGGGLFKPPATAVTPQGLSPFNGGVQLLAADLNADHKQDLILLSSYYTGTGITANGPVGAAFSFLGKGNGEFASQNMQIVGGTPVQAVLGDFTRAGEADLAVITNLSTGGALELLPGKGDGSFAAARALDSYGAGVHVTQIATADLNHDGKPDLVVMTTPPSSAGSQFAPPDLHIYLGKGNGAFSKTTIDKVGTGTLMNGFGLGDLNHDGKPDLIVTSPLTSQPNSFIYLAGNGEGGFKTGVPVTAGGSYTASGPILVQDLNNDGEADLFYSAGSDSVIALGKGDAAFGPVFDLRGAPKSPLAAAVDLNGDKRPDLVLSDPSGGVIVALNNGFGSPILGLPGSVATTTTLKSSANPAAQKAKITFTARVDASAGKSIPPGTVDFTIDSGKPIAVPLNASGDAAYSISTLAAGKHTVTAAYPGKGEYASSSSMLSETIDK